MSPEENVLSLTDTIRFVLENSCLSVTKLIVQDKRMSTL
jgi:hypothetical protein